MKNKKIEIIKMNGEVAYFDQSKLRLSLKRSGATEEDIQMVVKEVEVKLHHGMSTKEIYRIAFDILKKKSRPTAARYKLKKAIMELGISGFPFEKFIGELLTAEGFNTQVGVIVQGKCITHEVDVIAQKDNKHYMCECKFHNSQGRHCDVKIPLYIQSRFKDVEAQWKLKKGHDNKFHQGWIFTNTRFTTDAIQFAECSGLQLVSWDYPKGNAIKERIDRNGVHPITCLTSLSVSNKNELVRRNIITCKNLCNQKEILNELNISINKQRAILEEAKALCNK